MLSPLTESHRRRQLALRATTVRDLARLWPSLDWARLDATYPAFALAVARLVANRRVLSAALAAAYLRAIRQQQDVPGELTPILAGALPAAALATSLRVTSVHTLKAATARGIPRQRAGSLAFVRTAGAVSRHVLDGGRQTILGTLAADPARPRWQRVTSGRGCDFCSMLAGRGAVYAADTSDFRSHDHCGCTAEPIYRRP